jgi:predicted AAA+ superfamily ATPase
LPYIKRAIEDKLIKLLKHFPSVAILGPRQVGKTTLAKEIRTRLIKESIYLDLENPVDLGALDHPIEFFNTVSNKVVIIDEIQRKPDLFPILRSVIDQNRSNGRFILLGSASPELLFISNETLAGRIVHVELTPFKHSEISHLTDFRGHWLKGGFPEPFKLDDPGIHQEWMKAFLSAYIERDLRLLGLNTSPSILQKLIQMISSLQGGLLNASNLANSLGVSSPTISNAISFLERSFLIRLLKPWHTKIGKRLIKSPKVYIRDSGIINYLLGITSYEELLRHPLLGNLWDGYVIEDLINELQDEFNFYFYRTADGTECDLLLFKGNQCLAAIDGKFSPSPKRTKSMTLALKDLRAKRGFFVVPECPETYLIGENQYVTTPWQITEIIRSM